MAKPIKVDHSSIRKLEGTETYPLWKLSIENVLWAAGIHEIAFGTEARDAGDAAKQLKWDMGNRAAMSIILQTLEEKVTSHVFACKTAEQMWTVLANTYGQSTAWSKEVLQHKFHSLGLQDKSPTELVNQLQTVASQLNGMGFNNFDDEAIIGKVIFEMREPKFDSFVEAWNVLGIKRYQRPPVWAEGVVLDLRGIQDSSQAACGFEQTR